MTESHPAEEECVDSKEDIVELICVFLPVISSSVLRADEGRVVE